MSQRKSIKLSDGVKINLNSDGNIWWILNTTGGPCLGRIKHGACTVYWSYGLDEKTRHKYLPVSKLLLKYAKELHIRMIRVQDHREEESKYGTKVVIKYGYVKRDKFKSFLKQNKSVNVGTSPVRKVILIKRSDFTFKDE